MPKLVSLSPPMEAAAGIMPNRAVMVDIRKALLSAPKFMKALGLSKRSVEELGVLWIGKGHYAHVFELPDGRILKITDDEDDAMAAEIIRRANEAGEHPTGLPAIQDVKRFRGEVYEDETDMARDRPIFAIVTERVVPISKLASASKFYAIRNLLRYMANNAVYSLAEANSFFRGEMRMMAATLMEDPELQKRIDQAMQGVRWLERAGVEVRDLHANNIGAATGDRGVVFDFGHDSYYGEKLNIAIAKNSKRSMPKVRAAFDECFDALMEQFPDFGALELHQDEKAGSDNGHGSERQFGYCMDGEPIRVAFAAKTEKLPVANIRGLMAHEFGHALDYRYGDKLGKMLGQRLPEGVERRADAIAKAVFGRTIKYDSKDIQCVACQGKSVRPRRLGP